MCKSGPVRNLLLLSIALFVVAACDDTGFATREDGAEAPPYDVDDLTESRAIPAFGYQIDFPSTWSVTANADSLNLAAEETDLEQPFPPPTGMRVRVQSVDASELTEFGLDPSGGLDGLLAFNAEAFGWTEPLDPQSITVGDAPALLIRVNDPALPVSLAAVMGELGGRYYLLGLEGPSDDHLDAFWPVWEAMLASVRPS